MTLLSGGAGLQSKFELRMLAVRQSIENYNAVLRQRQSWKPHKVIIAVSPKCWDMSSCC